jgi:protein tyrosine phosphatase (PTP) superfamily phosphohydrolase (DUF442 family)
MNGKQRRRILLSIPLVVVAVFVCAVWLRRAQGNFGPVFDRTIYRSGQMGPDQLARTIRQYRIQTVLNLRGPNLEAEWYRSERKATLRAGATQVDVPLASDQWLSRDQARTLLEILDTCPKPLLVHCEWGAERTGLVAAICELLRPGGTVQSARCQFSIKYLFLPIRDGLVMRGHVDRYAAWLAQRGMAHSPGRFRRWVLEEYRPGTPSREVWPYDPYPLVVVTRPVSATNDTPHAHRAAVAPAAVRR